jgi:hypothetical protein
MTGRTFMYITIGTLPDIAHVVNKLASFLDCYCQEYWEAGIHIVHHSALSSAASCPLHSPATPIPTMPIAQPQVVPCPAPSPLEYIALHEGGDVPVYDVSDAYVYKQRLSVKMGTFALFSRQGIIYVSKRGCEHRFRIRDQNWYLSNL